MKQNCLKQIRNELGITQDELAHRLGIGKSAVSMIETGRASLSDRNKYLLVQELNVNPDWLKTGEGDMFTIPVHKTVSAPSPIVSEMTIPAQSIPLFALGNDIRFNDIIGSRDNTGDFIYVPNMPRCDGAIAVSGEGMEPVLHSGDIAIFKVVKDAANIIWGEIYIVALNIEGSEFIMIRYIKKSDKPGCIRLVSDNKRYPDQDVRVNTVNSLALVKASIRFHSIK